MIWPQLDLEYRGKFKNDHWAESNGWHSFSEGKRLKIVPKTLKTIEEVKNWVSSPILEIETPEKSPGKVNPFIQIKFAELNNKIKNANKVKIPIMNELFETFLPAKLLIENSIDSYLDLIN